MGTRAVIGIDEGLDAGITAITVDYDGGIESAGRRLFFNYSNPEKIRRLIEMECLMFLGDEVGTSTPHKARGESNYASFFLDAKGWDEMVGRIGIGYLWDCQKQEWLYWYVYPTIPPVYQGISLKEALLLPLGD